MVLTVQQDTMTEQLPTYSISTTGNAGTSTNAPPAYTFPESFTIGKYSVPPVVKTQDVKGHLALLHAFARLKSAAENLSATGHGIDGFSYSDSSRGPVKLNPDMPENKEQRWAWFVALAVERFERWCKVAQEPGGGVSDFLDNRLPPVDVIMVWHAYLLNPAWFYEDIHRIPSLRVLGRMTEWFSGVLPYLPEILSSPPLSGRIATWTSRTQTPFDLFEAAATPEARKVYCPACGNPCSVPLTTSKGLGYLQQNFVATCSNKTCSAPITKERLAVRRIITDLVTNDGKDEAFHMYMAGSLFTPTKPFDVKRGTLVKSAILKSQTLSSSAIKRTLGLKTASSLTVSQWEDGILKNVRFSLSFFKAAMGRRMRGGGGRLLDRIMSAYIGDKVFSIDLVGAVLRQGSFVTKMYDLHWTDPAFFADEENESVLQHATARYHAFLDLMSSSPASFFVPTLDIDLIWHTHQLMFKKYEADCMNYIGRFINHDDKVEENQLSLSFDLTCRAWQDRFGIRYVHCGCPVPGDKLGQKLRRLVKAHSEETSYLIPPSDRADSLNATHPSDHNAVYPAHREKNATLARKKRQEKYEERLSRDYDLSVRRRNNDHVVPFLVPVPMYYVGDIGGCVGTSWNAVNGAGAGASACAMGAGACATSGAACGSGAGCGSGGCGGGGGGCGGGGGGCGGGGGGGGCGGGGGGGS